MDLLRNFGRCILMLPLFISFSRPLYSDAKLKCHVYLAGHRADLGETRHKQLTLK
jgi:hypothetical protein